MCFTHSIFLRFSQTYVKHLALVRRPSYGLHSNTLLVHLSPFSLATYPGHARFHLFSVIQTNFDDIFKDILLVYRASH